jgi:enolase-phosphatase E1
VTELFLFDIEGTTTDINFVHKVLFPYSRERLRDFISAQKTHPQVMKDLDYVRQTVRDEEGKDIEIDEALNKLIFWIETDRKHPALKNIQGLIWEEGYSGGDFKGHVYDDVRPAWEKISSSQKKIGIYSSGSVHAQKLIFRHSDSGDLTPLISFYFDTKVGNKREKTSYENIIHKVGLGPDEIHFFSDIPEELQAAQAAGLKVTHVVREGTKTSQFPMIKNFLEL